MFTTRNNERTAWNGRSAPIRSLCGYPEFLMIKPQLPAIAQVCRGGVTSP